MQPDIRPERKPLTYLLLGGAAALLTWAAVVAPKHQNLPPPPPPPPPIVDRLPPPPPPPPGARPQVDVVFALDTTGSMSSLLEGAKKKIWEISRFIAQGQPAPELRVGLVAYRDQGDEYVTRFYDLTDDLDAVYQNLSALRAGGGGDTPEHVAKALHDAVNKASWSRSKNTLRIVYLVGDAPPHTDYNDGYNFHALSQQAGERGIRINTIRCGNDADTEVAWREIAQRAHGDYTTIDQGGGVVDVHTPFDGELAGLNARLSGTAYGYGAYRGEVAAKTAGALAAPAAVQAERASVFGLMRARKGKAAAVGGAGDLLEDASSGKVDVNAMPAADLPAPMQGLSAEGKKAWVAEKNQEREALLKQINEVSARRDAYLRTQAPAKADGFDGKVRASLKKQALSVDLKLE